MITLREDLVQGVENESSLEVVSGGPLRGTLRVPGDKSISHRALLLAARAGGRSLISGYSKGADVTRTIKAVEVLGAEVARIEGPGGSAVLEVEGGLGNWSESPRRSLDAIEVDCGNAGTLMRLLAGAVAGVDGLVVKLTGDSSLSSRPMDRVAEPLRAMGASVTGSGNRCLPPITVVGSRLNGIEWEPRVASAQVKSAILLAGIVADGETVVKEPITTRTNTEDLLQAVRADIEIVDDGEGRTIRVRRSKLNAFNVAIPGDPSQAAFWTVAGCVVPESEIKIVDVYDGKARMGFLSVLERMGADIELERRDVVESGSEIGFATLEISVRAGPLKGTVVEAAEIPSLDEVPILAVAAAAATGSTRFNRVGELRVKESDRLEGVLELVRGLGATAVTEGDDLIVEGVGTERRLTGTHVHTRGDHRMAMAGIVAALATKAGETSVIEDYHMIGTSYPGFIADVRSLAIV